jgi:cell division protein FtsQ
MTATKVPARPGSPRSRLLRRWLPGPRGLAILAVVAALLVGAWFWLRDSSLVAVRHVSVVGVAGEDAAQISSRLRAAALTMTTLDVSTGRLREAVASYPIVRSIAVSSDFPHGLRIDVTEDTPVALIRVGGVPRTVAADGRLVSDPNHGALASIDASLPPGAIRVSDAKTLSELSVLGTAPYRLLGRVARAATERGRGIVIMIRSGPTIVFGDGSQLALKWRAAVAVLGDAGSAGASYIDVTDPHRPAAGGGQAAAALALARQGTTTSVAPASSATAGTATLPSQTTAAATTTTSAPTGVSTGAATPPATSTAPAGTGTTPTP